MKKSPIHSTDQMETVLKLWIQLFNVPRNIYHRWKSVKLWRYKSKLLRTAAKKRLYPCNSYMLRLTSPQLNLITKIRRNLEPNWRKNDHAFVIRYTNHWIEKLNIRTLLHKQELQDTLPRCVQDQGEPTMVYKFKPTIRNKLFNYKETVSNFKHGNTNEVGCSCSGSQFIDANHGTS